VPSRGHHHWNGEFDPAGKAKSVAVNQVVNLAIGYVLTSTQGQQLDNLERGQRQVDRVLLLH
jgi:hypothetical protein